MLAPLPTGSRGWGLPAPRCTGGPASGLPRLPTPRVSAQSRKTGEARSSMPPQLVGMRPEVPRRHR